MSMRSIPNWKTGLSLHDVLMGRPMRLPSSPPLPPSQINIHLADDLVLQYCQALMKCVRSVHSQVQEALPQPTDVPYHHLEPGDCIYVKVHQRKNTFQPRWKGPFQVLLTTNTAVCCQGHQMWTHASHCKKVSPPLDPEEVEFQPRLRPFPETKDKDPQDLTQMLLALLRTRLKLLRKKLLNCTKPINGVFGTGLADLGPNYFILQSWSWGLFSFYKYSSCCYAIVILVHPAKGTTDMSNVILGQLKLVSQLFRREHWKILYPRTSLTVPRRMHKSECSPIGPFAVCYPTHGYKSHQLYYKFKRGECRRRKPQALICV
ncbi:uncharacterized protein LOC132249268 [Alligator mississippiensis]|uniref:uncharacterized protein LOC132249268 n=1 Tax=Alligator mississippiensis TaxID=8496 RepID=UPI0028780EB0|nr:uncharacterized protein LOC132249268 [Alligator mississippiensis]